MRNGRREVLFLFIVFLSGTRADAALYEGRKSAGGSEARVGVTIELSWTVTDVARRPQPVPAEQLSLASTEGVVADVVAWPADPSHTNLSEPRRRPDGQWELGTESSGRVRARLEVGTGSELVLRRGDHLVRIPLAAVLERPQHSPSQSPLSVTVERLPWDSLILAFGKGAEDGVVNTSSPVPVSVRYNLVWPEAVEVMVRTTAVLRKLGVGEPVWTEERRELVAANQLEPPGVIWTVPPQTVEGTYVLEFHADWEPSGTRESSRLSRLIRRRKPASVANSATRRMILAVVSPVDPESSSASSSAPQAGGGRETEVDALDMARIRTTRFSASGRSPAVAAGRTVWGLPGEVLLEAGRKDRDRERLRKWISRTVAESANLGPADDTGMAWSTVGLRVAHADKPHRLTLTVTGGDPSALGVGMLDPGATSGRPRLLLDACASGPPILKDGPPVTFSYLVWPDTTEPLLVVLNRNSSGPVRLGTVKLTELDAASRGALGAIAQHTRDPDHGTVPDGSSCARSIRRSG